MSRDPQRTTTLMPARRSLGPIAPVLIRVPNVATARRSPVRPASPRRRLRREIRVAAYGVLTALPLSWAIIATGVFGVAPATPAVASAEAESEADDSPIVSITLGPPAPASAFFATALEPVRTVTLPGYLLPDEGPEGDDHAGR